MKDIVESSTNLRSMIEIEKLTNDILREIGSLSRVIHSIWDIK